MSRLSAPLPMDVLVDVFRDTVAALNRANVECAVLGGFATWALAGIPPAMDEDIDLVIRPQDAVRAAEALHEAGMRIETCSEGWLFKAFHDATNSRGEHLFVDLIHDLVGMPIDDSVFERAVPAYVSAIPILCMAPDDMLSAKLLVCAPSMLDFTSPMQLARELREQIDWQEVERRVQDNACALGFFDVARRLGVDPRVGHDHVPYPASSSAATRMTRLDDDSLAHLAQLAEVGIERERTRERSAGSGGAGAGNGNGGPVPHALR